jgi:hypothetical protein
MEYTKQEMKRMREYERRTGQEIVISYERKLEIYRGKPAHVLEGGRDGIRRALAARTSHENEFDGSDDCWKTKMLQENLEAILEVLEEKRK